MGYPTDDDFREAHGWRRDPPEVTIRRNRKNTRKKRPAPKLKKVYALLVFLVAACAHVPAPKHYEGQIDQDTGLVFADGYWRRAWWSDKFDAAKIEGCHLEDSCGMFPPYYLGAQFCGDPEKVCDGEHWGPGGKPIKYTPDELKMLKDGCADLEEMKIVSPGKSPWWCK